MAWTIPLSLLTLQADFFRRTGNLWASYASGIPVYLGNDKPRNVASDETGEIVRARDILMAQYLTPGGQPLNPRFEDRVKLGAKLYQVKAIINAEHLGHHWEIELEEIQQGTSGV